MRRRPLREELHRVVGEREHREHVLAREVEDAPARDHERQPRGRAGELDKRGRKTNDDGVARLTVKARRAGILRVTVLGSRCARCSVWSGIVGVFKTPLTG